MCEAWWPRTSDGAGAEEGRFRMEACAESLAELARRSCPQVAQHEHVWLRPGGSRKCGRAVGLEHVRVAAAVRPIRARRRGCAVGPLERLDHASAVRGEVERV